MKKIVDLKLEKDYARVFNKNEIANIDKEILERCEKFVKIDDQSDFLLKLQEANLKPFDCDFDTTMLEEYIKIGDISFIMKRMIQDQTKDTMDDFILFFNNFITINSIASDKDLFLDKKTISLSSHICTKFNELFDN